MIIPSIDLLDGQAVQLKNGRDLKIQAGNPLPLADKFSLTGPVALIDLNAATGCGTPNSGIMEKMVRDKPFRVGGGIRDEESARRWLDAGAEYIILGTAARPDLLQRLPKQRLMAAVDCENGEVVTHGWKQRSGRLLEDVIDELKPFVSGFLVTLVENEGCMTGFDLARIQEIAARAAPARLTIAGGAASVAEIAELDYYGIDVQVGMALYSGKFSVDDVLVAILKRSGELWPTVVCDENDVALGLAWSSPRSLEKAIAQRRGIYQSRKRGLWIKGETSGNTQELLSVHLDCDRDALRFRVRQNGPFCHTGARTCWGESTDMGSLQRHLKQTIIGADPNSYTLRLLNEPGLLPAKIMEEALELIEASSPTETTREAADLFYFVVTLLESRGVSIDAVTAELDYRSRKVSRRPGNRKNQLNSKGEISCKNI